LPQKVPPSWLPRPRPAPFPSASFPEDRGGSSRGSPPPQRQFPPDGELRILPFTRFSAEAHGLQYSPRPLRYRPSSFGLVGSDPVCKNDAATRPAASCAPAPCRPRSRAFFALPLVCSDRRCGPSLHNEDSGLWKFHAKKAPRKIVVGPVTLAPLRAYPPPRRRSKLSAGKNRLGTCLPPGYLRNACRPIERAP